MLAPLEADLARRDPGVPGLATVLDADAFLEALRREAPGRDVRGAAIRYVRYRPHEYCRASYSVDVQGTPCELDVRAGRSDERPARPDRAHDGSSSDPLGTDRLLFQDSGVIVTVFPNDSSLPQVSALADPALRPALLRELLPDRPELWAGELRRLRYWPGRRYSAELGGEAGSRALLKAYTRKGYLRARRHAEAFRSSGPLRVARLLGSCDRHRLLAFEWLPGRMLSDLWLVSERERETADTGAALAALHAQSPAGLECWTREDESAYFRSLAFEIGFLSPLLATRAERIAARLVEWLAGTAEVHFPAHCDFSDSQVLIDGADVAIVDLDSARCADPADDLGAMLAQLESYELMGKLPSGRASRMKEAFLAGYGRGCGEATVERSARYAASGLLRRARFAFRARKPDWHRIAEASLERAEAITAVLSK